MSRTSRSASALAATTLIASGCGGGKSQTAKPPPPRPSPSTTAIALPPAALTAEHVTASEFPAPHGRSLQQLASTLTPGPQLALAVSVLTPGSQHLAFGLLSASNEPLYIKSAVYIAATPKAPAQGPYAAPLDWMIPQPPYLSKTVATDSSAVKAVYETTVPFPRPGRYSVLTISKVGATFLGAAASVNVVASSPIPNIGHRAPLIHTPTAASVGGDLAKIDTRIPPDDMQRVDFASVIGKRPVALLFATPALCQSRTCGPVTDQAVELEHEFRGRMTFIHNEVYVDNDPRKGYRPQLRAFHLQTEPWLFTFDRRGRVAARIEGAFGLNAFRHAIEAALK
jgi:hypothetical protein